MEIYNLFIAYKDSDFVEYKYSFLTKKSLDTEVSILKKVSLIERINITLNKNLYCSYFRNSEGEWEFKLNA